MGNPNSKDELGRSQLYHAAEKKDIEKTRKLIAAGALVDDCDNYGETALHCLGWNGCKEVAELILNAGADPTCFDLNGETPLHCSARNNTRAVAIVLCKFGADPN